MMISAERLLGRAEKIIRLRRPALAADNVDRTFALASLCARMSARWYARGHAIVEYEYGRING